MDNPDHNGATAKPSDDFDFQDFEPQTELGRELWEIRRRAIAAGMKLLDADELEREIAERRGSLVVVKDDPDVR